MLFFIVVYSALFFYCLRFIPLWTQVGFVYLIPIFCSLPVLADFKYIHKKIFWVIVIFIFIAMMQFFFREAEEVPLTFTWLRFFFGFLVFLFFFYRYYHFSPKRLTSYLPLILKIVVVEAIIESLLINTFVSPLSLPNAPQMTSLQSSHFSEYATPIGPLRRLFGIGGLASITAPLIISLLAMVYGLEKKKFGAGLIFLSLFAVLIAGSGSGYLTLIVVTMLWVRPKYYVLIVPIFCIVLLSGLFLNLETFQYSFLYKISPQYISVLFGFFKVSMYNYFQHLISDPASLYFGNPHMGETDSAIIGFFKSGGLLLFLLYFGFLAYFTLAYRPFAIRSKHFFLGITALVVGSLHYPVLYVVPTHMILGALFAEGLIDRKQNRPIPVCV